jgi:DNA-binding MarR family transcriptional regulator
VYIHMPPKSTDKAPAFESKCVAFALRKSALTVGRIYSAQMAEAPLRGPLFSLMMTIRRTGPATISALAREVGLERTTLTRDLRSLEQRGLIRISAAEANSKSVVMTKLGEREIAQSLVHWQAAQDRVLEALGNERWERMRADLAAVMALEGI